MQRVKYRQESVKGRLIQNQHHGNQSEHRHGKLVEVPDEQIIRSKDVLSGCSPLYFQMHGLFRFEQQGWHGLFTLFRRRRPGSFFEQPLIVGFSFHTLNSLFHQLLSDFWKMVENYIELFLCQTVQVTVLFCSETRLRFLFGQEGNLA